MRRIFTLFAALLLIAVIGFWVLNKVYPLTINVDYATIITDKDDEVIHAYLSNDDKWRMKTELHEISATLKKAIVHKEDKYFYKHFGVNPIAILRAITNNITKGKRTSGASTITMQVARLLNPKPRTYKNKLIEIFKAIQLEMAFTKDEILQLYLNLVPYGGNIEGVKAAALIYCNKAPNHLSLAEITTLSIIPNRPTSLRPGKNDDLLIQERNKWLQRFKQDALFDNTFIEDALEESFLAHRYPIPKKAPHLAQKLLNEQSNTHHIKSTLNTALQSNVEDIVKNYARKLKNYKIKNAAVLVVDNTTNQVLAYVASADFYNNEDGGQVNGIEAVRSPGSTLKPLIYALGFDKGTITPKLKVEDLPVDFSGYSPTNYSDTYSGMVTVEQALQQSLNVPAVKVLNNIGVPTLIARLGKMQFKQIVKDEQKLGLSLALGGCGVRLSELTAMYSTFANKGQYRGLRFLKDASATTPAIPIVSKSAAYLVTDVLQNLNRPNFSNNLGNIANLPNIAWKTGTSYGRKDAWSVGYNNHYTVGVWVGNFSGKGVPELTGSDMATPLLFSVFQQISKNNGAWNFPPAELKHTWVCSETGHLPAEKCEHQILDFHLPLITKQTQCKHLIDVAVNTKATISYCKHCAPIKHLTKTYNNYRPAQIAFYESNKTPYQKIPMHNPTCERYYANESLKIISPKANVDYYFLKDDNDEILLESHIAAGVAKVHWYINDSYFTSAVRSEATFFKPIAGKNKITCVDDKGRSSSLFIEVFYL